MLLTADIADLGVIFSLKKKKISLNTLGHWVP